MLQSKGYRVLASPDGKTALNAAAKSLPDLILLDINMPEMNGFEVCERLKANELLKDIPILFISALTETTDKVKAFSVGGVDYISKPFQFEEVNARVETHLKIRALQRQLGAQNENLRSGSSPGCPTCLSRAATSTNTDSAFLMGPTGGCKIRSSCCVMPSANPPR